MKVLLITAASCSDCKRMKEYVLSCRKSREFEIIEYDSEKEESINLAIQYSVSDIPACIVIGSKVTVIEGSKFDKSKISMAIFQNE